MVGLEILQSILFTVLSQKHVFPPTKYVSYDDFSIGLEWFILTIEMFFVSVMFIRSFEFAPYRLDTERGIPRQGIFKALLEIINPMDFIQGTWWMLTCFSKKYSAENINPSRCLVHGQQEYKQTGDIESGSSASATSPPVGPGQRHYP